MRSRIASRVGVAAVLSLLVAGCHHAPRAGAPPERAPIAESEDEPVTMAFGGPPEDLGDCVLAAGDGAPTTLRCGRATLAEIRSPARSGPSAQLDEVMSAFTAREGDSLQVESGTAAIDGATVELRLFRRPASGERPSAAGLVVALPNREGAFWALACSREDEPLDREWCARALLNAARRGGLAHVGARVASPSDFGGSPVEVPAGCERPEAARIRCDSGELSWRPLEGDDPAALIDQTRERLRSLARPEGLILREDAPRCRVSEEEGRCIRLHLGDPASGESLTLLLATEMGSAAEYGDLLLRRCSGAAAAPLQPGSRAFPGRFGVALSRSPLSDQTSRPRQSGSASRSA